MMKSAEPKYDPRTHHFNVMVSSTYKDLVNHRQEAIKAIRDCSMYPTTMEVIEGSDDDILTNSLEMVAACDVYVGILGSRYGQVLKDPRNPKSLSITELEYEFAHKNKKQIYIFSILEDDDKVLLNQAQETKVQQNKLKKFQKLLESRHALKKTALEDLRAEVSRVLRVFRDDMTIRFDADMAAHRLQRGEGSNNLKAMRPEKPVYPYGGHPSNIQDFIGREADIQKLDQWGKSNSHKVAVIQALGGMGKSTLAWQWVHHDDHAPKIMNPAGVIWWNFYNPNATMKEFIRHALAYITDKSMEDFDEANIHHHADKLFSLLRQQNYLLVMDGLERILVEYRDPNSPQLVDDAIPIDRRRRACVNPFDGYVLAELADCNETKLLITTRLFPTHLEMQNYSPMPTVWLFDLKGLLPTDALKLAGDFGIKRGDPKKLTEFFKEFDFHPLVIKVIAGSVVRDEREPGNFDSWYNRIGKDLSFVDLDIRQRRTMIFEYALKDLTKKQREILAQVAAFGNAVPGEDLFRLNPYLPAAPPYPELPPIPQVYPNPLDLNPDEEAIAKMVKDEARLRAQKQRVIAERRKILKEWRTSPEVSPPKAERKLEVDLSVLVNRGLLQRNVNDSTYDLHPLLRRYINDDLDPKTRARVIANVRKVYGSVAPSAALLAKSLSDLMPYIRNYEDTIAEGNHDQAASIFLRDLRDLLYKWGEFPRIITLLQKLYIPNEDDSELFGTVRVEDKETASNIRHEMARSLEATGQLEAAQNQYSENFLGDIDIGKHDYLIVALICYGRVQKAEGRLTEWHKGLSLALQLAQVTNDDTWTYSTKVEFLRYYIVTGQFDEYRAVLSEMDTLDQPTSYASKDYDFAQTNLQGLLFNLWNNHDTKPYYEKLDNLTAPSYILNLNIGYWLAYADFKQLTNADFKQKNLEKALDRIDLVIKLLSASNMQTGRALALRAEILLASGRQEEAIHSLQAAMDDKNSDRTERADLLNSAAQISLKLGQRDKAEQDAREAFETACVQGTPHVYWWGLQQAQAILQSLNLPIPEIPVFDAKAQDLGSIPHEAAIHDFIEHLQVRRSQRLSSKQPNPDAGNLNEVQDIRWVTIGVIAYFGVKEADKSILVDIATKLYSMSDNPGVVDPTDSDQLVDPDATHDGKPFEPGIARMTFDEVRELINPITLASVASKHDGIAILFVHAHDPEGKPVWFFMSIRVEKLMGFFEQVQQDNKFKISSFGRVVHRMPAPPARDDLDMMFDNWLYVRRYLAVKLIARRAGGG